MKDEKIIESNVSGLSLSYKIYWHNQFAMKNSRKKVGNIGEILKNNLMKNKY